MLQLEGTSCTASTIATHDSRVRLTEWNTNNRSAPCESAWLIETRTSTWIYQLARTTWLFQVKFFSRSPTLSGHIGLKILPLSFFWVMYRSGRLSEQSVAAASLIPWIFGGEGTKAEHISVPLPARLPLWFADMATVLPEFERAVAAFKKKADLDEAELADFQLPDLQSLHQAINGIQNQQAKDKKLMYMGRLKPFLDTMKDYGQVLEVFLNTSNFVAFVWVRVVPSSSYYSSLTCARVLWNCFYWYFVVKTCHWQTVKYKTDSLQYVGSPELSPWCISTNRRADTLAFTVSRTLFLKPAHDDSIVYDFSRYSGISSGGAWFF